MVGSYCSVCKNKFYYYNIIYYILLKIYYIRLISKDYFKKIPPLLVVDTYKMNDNHTSNIRIEGWKKQLINKTAVVYKMIKYIRKNGEKAKDIFFRDKMYYTLDIHVLIHKC